MGFGPGVGLEEAVDWPLLTDFCLSGLLLGFRIFLTVNPLLVLEFTLVLETA